MAKEWYLLGNDNDLLYDYEEEEFLEILDSTVAIDVELYNYDLSECQQIRAIIEGRTKDTKLNSLARQAIVPIGTFKAGMYIKYNDRFWLVVGLVDDNGVYEKGVLALCMYHLTWINHDGNIIQRWANVTSASQYNNGETGVQYYFVRSDQLLVIIPDDDESLLIDSDARFIIDKRCSIYEKSFADDVTESTDNPLIVYKLTRNDNVLYNYQDSGHSEFIATQCEQQDADGYYVVDGKGYWLCEKPTTTDNSQLLSQANIIYEESIVYNGMGETVFVGKLYDESGDEDTESVLTWSIDSDFSDKLNITYSDNSISISVDDEDLINKSFELSLSADGYDTVTVTVEIKSFF